MQLLFIAEKTASESYNLLRADIMRININIIHYLLFVFNT